MLTRLTATVIISAPDASCAFTMTAGDEYLPVPTMRREVNVLSAIVKLSMPVLSESTAAHEIHDFDLIAFADDRIVEGRALEDDDVVLHGDAACVNRQAAEQFGHRHRLTELEWFAVQGNDHRTQQWLHLI